MAIYVIFYFDTRSMNYKIHVIRYTRQISTILFSNSDVICILYVVKLRLFKISSAQRVPFIIEVGSTKSCEFFTKLSPIYEVKFDQN